LIERKGGYDFHKKRMQKRGQTKSPQTKRKPAGRKK